MILANVAAAETLESKQQQLIYRIQQLQQVGGAPYLAQISDAVPAVAHVQSRVFEAAIQFARAEGIVPAPESSHAIRSEIGRAHV